MSTHVYYAVDGSESHFFMLEKSIASLRRHNTSIAIRVHSFAQGAAVHRQRAALAKFDKVSFFAEEVSADPFLLKWRALEHQDAETVVFLDADTYFFDDISILLKDHAEQDFYAREEVGTEAHGKTYLVGNTLIGPQLDRALFKRICEALGSRGQTVFNTGIMVFNHGSAPRVSRVARKYLGVFANKFRSGDYAYPCTNARIVEEIAAAIVLGMVDIRTGFLDGKLAPFFIEWKTPTIVVHTWSAYYPHFLARVEGRDAALAMPGSEHCLIE